jgi:hypothetical protein
MAWREQAFIIVDNSDGGGGGSSIAYVVSVRAHASFLYVYPLYKDVILLYICTCTKVNKEREAVLYQSTQAENKSWRGEGENIHTQAVS